MNIVNKLTLRHMRENKRRSLVTVIGVIISVAMVAAVATLSVSFLDLMKRQTISQDGEWHVQYENVDAEQLKAIENDEETKKLIVENDLGYAEMENSENQSKPYAFIKEYNAQGLSQFPIQISEGRLPNEQTEVMISEAMLEDGELDYEIGDQLTLEVGQRYNEGVQEPLTQQDPLQSNENGVTENIQVESTESFTITGVMERPTWEPSWAPGYTMVSYMNQSQVESAQNVDAVVVLKDVNRSLYEHAESLAEKHNIEKVSFNNELLRYYGVSSRDNLNRTMLMLAAVIMAVIITGSIALIYNAFAISVSERTRHLGMLSSVGATKKQKRNSVLFEGGIIGLISIPIGLLAGVGGIAITFSFINSYLEGALGIPQKLDVVVTPVSIAASCVISMATIFVSSYLPAKRASNISAIDAIRQSHDIKLSKKAVKTSPLVRKIFGIEAEIGLKNMKRNKRRYLATVFSLVVSIVLFLSVSYFTNNLKKSYEISQEEINFDIQVSGSSQLEKSELEPLTQLKNVTDSIIIEQVDLNTLVDPDSIAEPLKDDVQQNDDVLENGKYPYYVVLHALDKESFNSYLQKAGIDGEQLQNGDHPGVIVIDKISYEDSETRKFRETKSIDTTIGEEINLYSMNHETEEKDSINKVEVGALTDAVPMGVNTSYPGGVDLVVSSEMMDEIITEPIGQKRTSMYMNSSDPMATQSALEDAKKSEMNVYNVHQERKQNEQVIMFLSIFAYGFIVLISAISIANIFNTISTSISLRKREFAMLKSVGMTPRGFDKMINYESIFYGVKALLYGLPVGFIVMILLHLSFKNTFDYGFLVPWWNILFVIVAIFLIVSAAMLYSIKKIKKENIIETLKQENV
ncbi:ABC transporter permease [Halobacillus sp. Marseille-P3879]|uniref:ABC transporter permease n=1 Tax=Halobacillus sp. Marseille-P3879 TaxID=2045014 RepID=UPI000C7D96B6|nr:ABC transporter permease [Halobacillus sp. Marseille-P3879]